MKKQLLLLAIFAVYATALKSQVAEYFFYQQSNTYTPLSSETVLWSGTIDNEVTTITIPSFTINSQSYTSLTVSSNGFVTFGDVIPAAATANPISNSAAYDAVISALGVSLMNSGSGNPKVSYHTNVGGEIVIQWQDVKRQAYAGEEAVSFQIRLNPATQVVRMVYGGFSTAYTGTSYAVQVGMRGVSNSDFSNRITTTNWSATTAGTGNTGSCRFNSTVFPASGLTFLWKPLYNPTSFTATALDNGSIDLGWVKNEFNHNVMVGFRQASSTIGTPVNGTAYTVGMAIPGGGNVLYIGDATGFSHTDLVAGTQYHYKIWSYDGLLDYSKGAITNSRTAYTLPYLQPFNSMPAEWSSNMSVSSNHGTTGTSGLTRRLNSSSTTYYAISPMVGSITSDTRLSFHYRIVDNTGFPLNATVYEPGNILEVQVAIGDDGTFSTIHTIDHNNHISDTEFANVVLNLGAYNGQYVKIRFLPTWASGDYYLNIDNVLFEDGMNMSYSGATTTQPNTTNVAVGSQNNDIIRLQVVTQKSANPLIMTSITFNTTGSTAPVTNNIEAAKVFYTTTPEFSTATQFGSASSNPSDDFTITGNQSLVQGNNYFWLAYDIKETAVIGNVVDARCTSFITSESGIGKIPQNINPAGNRKIGGEISGIKTIPGDFATLAEAVNALNDGVIGSGGVTVNLTAGHTENITAPIVLRATGTSSRPIVFQKSGGGANPLITRTDAGTINTSSIGNHGDGVIIIEGSDYVTFDAIDVATENQGIEYGYYIRKASVTDACQHVTVKNCNITLTKGTSRFVVGLCVANNGPAASSISVTTPSGAHQNITLTGNTISNVFTGVYLSGHSTFMDQDFVIGAAGAGNIIQNFAGNVANEAFGIYTQLVENCDISHNNINNTAGGGSPFAGGGVGIGSSTSFFDHKFIARNNSVHLTSQNTGGNLFGIKNSVLGEVMIENNTIALNNTVSASGLMHFINHYGNLTSDAGITIQNNNFAASELITTGMLVLINNNHRRNTEVNVLDNFTTGIINRQGASGSLYCYYNQSQSTGIENIGGNNFSNISVSGITTFFGIFSDTHASHTQNVFNNTFSNISAGTGTLHCIELDKANTRNVYGNTLHSISSGAQIRGLILKTGSQEAHIYKNSIYNISSEGTHTSAVLIAGIQVTSGSNVYIYNNFISDLNAANASNIDVLRAISLESNLANSTIGLYFNTIYLDATSAMANFGTTGIYHWATTVATTASLDMRNNIIVNVSQNNGSSGRSVAFRRSGTSLSNFSEISDNNLFYAGTPGTNNLIYHNGTNGYQSLEAYQAHVAPREANSRTELPPFVNVSAKPYDLHIKTDVLTLAESGGQPITSPIAITDDFDGDSRLNPPDMGADEFDGVSGFVANPQSFSVAAINSQQIQLAFETNAADNQVVIVFNTTGSFSMPAGDPVLNEPLAGGTVIFIGTESPFIHSALNHGTTYYYKAFSYDGASYSVGITGNASAVVGAPQSFAAIATSQSQIDVSWQQSLAGHDVILVAHTSNISGNPVNGTAYNTGDAIPGGGIVVYKGPAEVFQHSGFNAWTQHFFKIWSLDEFDFYSTAQTAMAITYAETVTTFPYIQNFDGTWSHSPAAPPGWNVLDMNGDGTFTWKRETSYRRSAPASARGYGNGVCNDYLISPPMSFPNQDLNLTWWDAVNNAANVSSYKVLLSTTNKEPSSFTVELGDFTCTNTTWTQRSIDLSAWKNQTVFIAFHQYYTNNQYQYFTIDDVVFETVLPGTAELVWPLDGLNTFNEPQTLRWIQPYSSVQLLGNKVYFGTDPNPPLVYDGLDEQWTTGSLAYGTTYYWKVVSYTANGESQDVPLWSFSIVGENQLAESFEGEQLPPVGWGWDHSYSWSRVMGAAFHGNFNIFRSAGDVSRKIHTPLVSVDASSALSFAAFASHDHLKAQVYYSTNKASWLTAGSEIDLITGVWNNYNVSLNAIPAGDYYLAIGIYRGEGATTGNVALDHIIGPDIVPVVPAIAHSPSPPDGSEWVAPSTGLSWLPGIAGGIPDGYKVYLGTNGGGVTTPTNLVNGNIVTQYSFDIPFTLDENTLYYWQIVPTNSAGDAPNCPIWSFSTFPNNAVQIGFGDEDWTDLPIDVDYAYSYTQSIYLQQEIGVSRWINKIAYQWDGYFAAPNSSDWVIYMGHTTKTLFADDDDWVPTSQMVKVFDGMVNIPAGPVWIEIELDTPFLYNNADNLVIAVDENTSGWDSGSFLGTWTDDNRSIGAYDDWNNYDPDYPPAGYPVDGFPNTRLYLSETGPPPQLGVNPMLVDFGFVNVDEESGSQTISITNIGGGLLLVNSIELAGDDMDDFELTINNALPLYIYTYDNYEVELVFKPLSKGSKTAMLLLEDNTDGKTATEVELYGFGEPIDPPQSFEATTEGLTSILLEWEKNATNHNVMIATSTENNIGEPIDGTEYLLGDNLPGGGVIIYKGSLESFLHTGLNSSSGYFYRIWSVTPSDKYSYPVEAYGVTTCNAVYDIPLSENFDDTPNYHLPLCWTRIIGEPAEWGEHWIGVYGGGITFYNSYEIEPTLILVTPELNSPINNLSIRFKAICPARGEKSEQGHITIGVIEDPTDAASFIALKDFDVGWIDYTSHKYYFHNYNGTARHIAIKANFYFWSIHFISIDDVLIDYLPSCLEPDNLIVNNIGYNSVDFSWQPQFGETLFEVRGGPTGFDVDNYFQGFTYENQTNTTLTISSLTHSTIYDLYVRAVCDVNDKSEWAGPLTFTTLCEPVEIPVEENFDAYLAGDVPLCWSVIITESNTAGIIDYSYFSATNAFALNNYFYDSDGVFLISPGLAGDINDMYLKFFARRSHTSTPLMVGTMSDPTDGSTFQEFLTQSVSTNWQQYNVFFSSVPENHQYIAFKLASYGFIELDDILIEQAETCLRPTHLRVESLGSDNAILSWLPGTPEDNSWEIKYGPPGFDPDFEGTFDSGIYEVPHSLSYLNPSTSYHAYVRTVCGPERSVWTGPVQFTTLCSDQDRCNYSVIMTDSEGDGWDGTILGFKQNGVVVQTFGEGFNTGSSFGPVDIPLCPGFETRIVVVEPGGYTQEKGFSLYDPDGELIFQRIPGNSFTASTIFYTFISDCESQGATVPVNLSIENEIVQDNQIECYNAEQVITVAGNGKYFVVQNGATARLIAGQKIVMLPGTHFQEGSYGRAFIDLSGLYCSDYTSIVSDTTAFEADEKPSFECERKTQFFKLYPNPTSGGFTLELYEFEDNSIVSVEIYSIFGSHILSAELKAETQYVFDLWNQPAGLYLVRVRRGDKIDVVKLIKK